MRLASAVFGDDAQSPGELLELIRWLPERSALRASQIADAARREANGEKPEQTKADPFSPFQWFGWDIDRYAVTALVDEQRLANYYTLMVNRDPKSGKKPTQPTLFPVPGQKKKADPMARVRRARDKGLYAQQKRGVRGG